MGRKNEGQRWMGVKETVMLGVRNEKNEWRI